MASLISLESYDPSLRNYLQQHRYPAMLEALLCGLSVMVPEDPWQFISEKLLELAQSGNPSNIHWDMFVDANMWPKPSFFRRGMMDLLMDEADLPTQEMFEKAFEFRKKSLQRLYFDAWRVYYEQERQETLAYQQRLVKAKTYYTNKMENLIFTRWRSYAARRKACRWKACQTLQRVSNRYVLNQLFYAWEEDYKESRRARIWFNKREAGEGEGEGDEDDWCWTEGEDPVSLLPRSVAVRIFMHLSVQSLCRCGCVCHTWKEITEDPQLWNKVDLSSIADFVRDQDVMRVTTKYRPLLCHLNLRGCGHLSADSIKAIGYCRNLQDLNLSETQGLNEEAIQSIGKGCTGLLYLNLSFCYVTDSIIRLLTKHFSSLHYLSLAHAPHFTHKSLLSITTGKGCRRLVYLDLSGCTQLCADSMALIGKGCPILATLLLDDIPQCSDVMILKLVNHCHSLRHISFMGGSTLSDKAFKHLAVENRKLRTIKIENNAVITDMTLRALGKACKELTHIYIAGCSRISDQGLRALANLKKLQVLNIADCTKVSDAGVRHVVENAPGLQLKELNLTNLSKLSDVTLLRISQSCRCLTCLSFCYCEHITDTGVELLGHIPTLSSLDLSGCNIQDEGIRGLGFNPQFRYLMLAELQDITDDGLQRMSSTLSQLNTLDLSDCEQVTDSGIEQVTFNCRMLRSFYLANCHKVTDNGTKYIAKGCPYISQLDMSGCTITDRSLSLLRKFSSNLQRLDILCCTSVTREAVLKMKIEVNYNTDQPKFLQGSPLELPPETLEERIGRM